MRNIGDTNRFHNLNAYWLALHRDRLTSSAWKEFQNRLKALGAENRSAELKIRPWEETSPLAVMPTTKFDTFHKAFRVRQQLADLRVPEKMLKNMIGAESCDGVPYFEGTLDPPKE